jgi:hypothetical protein
MKRKEYVRINRDRINERQVSWLLSDPRITLLYGARSRAKSYGVECSITKDDIFVPSFCPILGIPIVKGDGNVHRGSPSVDRIRPNLGYTADNIRVISYRANTLKSDASLEEHRLIYEDAKSVNPKKQP